MSGNLKELHQAIKIKQYDAFFGKDNYLRSNKRFRLIKRVLSNDEIVITTNNISYWRHKDQLVLWVDNDKIVYLKFFQITPVYNHEILGDTYLVKLNRKYFKAYNCYANNELSFDKQDSFDDLKLIAEEQEKTSLWFKPSTDKYGNISGL